MQLLRETCLSSAQSELEEVKWMAFMVLDSQP